MGQSIWNRSHILAGNLESLIEQDVCIVNNCPIWFNNITFFFGECISLRLWLPFMVMISPLTRPLFSLLTSATGSTFRPVSTELEQTNVQQLGWILNQNCEMQDQKTKSVPKMQQESSLLLHVDLNDADAWSSTQPENTNTAHVYLYHVLDMHL